MSKAALPRNTTRQAETMLYGNVSRIIHRLSGAVIIVFVLAHMIVQAVRHVPMFSSAKAGMPWLEAVQQQNWVHAILFFCIVFHTLYGLKLLAGELGFNIRYQAAFWGIVGLSSLFALREIARYVGV
jgi:succinate dehydrogenase/fumarate reductase cytochrome b subunit